MPEAYIKFHGESKEKRGKIVSIPWFSRKAQPV